MFNVQGLISIGTGGHLATMNRRTKLWHYITNDTLAAVATNGYFDSYDENFQTGDIVFVTADVDGTLAGEVYTMTVTEGDVALTKFVDAT